MTTINEAEVVACGRQCVQALRIADQIEQGVLKDLPPYLDADHYRGIASYWSKQAFIAARGVQ